MPLSPDAWASIGTTLFNTGSQLYTNSQNRKNALADWNRQNAYNNPKQQMQRYKEAGLNPNLIYNQQNTAQPVRSTDYVAPQAPDFQGVLAKSAQIKLQDQQLKNMSLQNDAIAAQILKTKADALYVASNTKFKDLDVERLRGQLPGLVEGVQLRNESTKQEIANKVADTNNKIAQLPILEKQKEKLGYEIDKIMRTNAFIELNNNQQRAVQRAMEKSIEVVTDLNRKKVVTEDFNQQYIDAQIRKIFRNETKDENIDMSWLTPVINIASMLLPYNMGRILPKFNPPK
jgi:hypothetical protein